MKFKKNKSAPRVVSRSLLRQHATETIASTKARELFLASASVAALTILSPGSATAQTWTGATSSDWTVGTNWSGGVPVGGLVTINTNSPNPTVIGVGGTVSANSGQLYVGRFSGGSGNLTIQNGSTLTSTGHARIAEDTGSTGVATITGAGTTWTINAVNTLIVGNGGMGTLNIADGATVNANNGYTVFGTVGTGILNLTSGGKLNTTGGSGYLGSVAGGVGIANVSGAGSHWSITGQLWLGAAATGTLTIENGGRVVAGTGTTIANNAGVSGTLNINSAGVLETQSLARGLGTAAQANFDGGVLQARANNASFITGFSGTQLNIAAGGLTINTAGFTVGTASTSGFSGTGGLTKTGGGTLSLAANNTYAGETLIQAGALALTGAGSIANSSRVVVNSTFDISGLTGVGTSIQSLAGNGAVTRGTKNLTLTNANDTFAGAISGSGGLAISGGTQTLTGTSNYTGTTNVTGSGGLQLLNGGQITSTSATTLNGPSVTGTVSGSGSLLRTGTLAMGGAVGSNVTLNILDGGVVETTVNSQTTIAGGSGAQTATVNVDGAGSLLDLEGTLGIGSVNAIPHAFLNITNGGAVRSTAGFVGAIGGSGTKSVVISGPGSNWAVTGALNLNGNGSISILSGGTATAASSLIGNGIPPARLLVSGAGSSYVITGNATIGSGGGTGIVTLADGGGMSVGGALTLASTGSATGVLNIGGAEGLAATSAGILNAATLTFGSGTGRVNFNHTDANYVFSTAMSGGGAVNQVGSGRTVLTGTNTYTGGTTIGAGALQLGNGGASGSITGNVTNNGAFIFNRSDTHGFAGVISGTGTVGQTGSGTTVLTGTNTYAGGTVITAGTMQIGNGGTAGSITGDVQNDGTLAFNRSDEMTFAGVIGGTGAVNQIGVGTTVLTGNSVYTGPTTISSGTLQIGNGGTSGQVIGPILNNSMLAFNRSDAFLVPGAISGTGTVNQIGTGTAVFEGANTYTGGTTITSSALRIGNGGTTGSIVGNVINNGALEFFRSNEMNFEGVISGGGSIRQIGSGLTNLTGDSSAFAGTTSVEAGTLAVNGNLCGNMNVLAGGRLQGAGTVCTTSNTGTIAPGNSIGTLTVAGNFVGNGGLLEMETVLGGDASPTDRLVVTGDTSGNTSVRVVNRGGLGAPTVEGIRIIDVGGASNGSFTLQGDYLFMGQQAVIAGAYAYVLQRNGVSTPNDGDWYLRSSLTNPPPPAPGSPPPDPVLPFTGSIYAPTVPVYESYAQVMLSLNELPSMQQRIGQRFRSGPDAMASMGVPDATVSNLSPLWARIEGGHKNLNPLATARSSLDIDHSTFEGGVDLVNVESGAGRWLVGVVGNYLEGKADVFSLFGNGKVRVSGGGVGGTVTWLGDAGFYFDGQGRASWYNGELRSLVLGPIISGNDGFGYAFSGEIGQRFGIGDGWSITPQLQMSYGRVTYGDFADRFGGQVSLSKAESLLTRGGFAINHQHSWRDAAGQLLRSDVYGIANASYEFKGGAATLVTNTSFASNIDRLWGSVGAGGTFSWAKDKVALYGEVSYNTSLSEPGDSYSYKGTAGLRVRW